MGDWRDEYHKRILNKKWKSLEKRGITRPKTSEENRRRAKEARGY